MIDNVFSPAVKSMQQQRAGLDGRLRSHELPGFQRIVEAKEDNKAFLIREQLLADLHRDYDKLIACRSAVAITTFEGGSQQELKAAIEQYAREEQVFSDAIYAAKIQLEECGYQFSSCDSLFTPEIACQRVLEGKIELKRLFESPLNIQVKGNSLMGWIRGISDRLLKNKEGIKAAKSIFQS